VSNTSYLYTDRMENEIVPPNNEENEKTAPAESKKSTFKEIVKEVITFAIIAFCIVLPFRIYIAEPYLVDGRSMDPTFATGDYLIVDKLSYQIGTPKRNSVIVFKYPNDPSKSFIKRVIALPGETIKIKDDTVTIINKDHPEGFKVDESYVVHTSPANLEKTLGNDEYFVMGDNRAESFDSRSWGPLNKKYILGKPIIRLWPLNEIGLLPGDDTTK